MIYVSLRERIRAIAEALPTEAARVELSKADLLSMLEEGGSAERSLKDQEPLMDLSVAEIMEATGKARSTVIGWINNEGLEAYRFGREWRVTRASWRDFMRSRNAGDRIGKRASRPVGELRDDLGSWRGMRSG